MRFSDSAPTSSFWRGRSVVVTGSAGFLGGWLVSSLGRLGAGITALARSSGGERRPLHPEWPHNVLNVNCDITSLECVRRVIAERGAETVFHLAAQPLAGAAVKDPAGTLDVNVRGTWTVLEAARVSGKCQVVVASSAKVYGAGEDGPLKESSPIAATGPYGVAKGCADLIATMYAGQYGQPIGIVRCGNLFGGGDLNLSRVIPGAIAATLAGQRFAIQGDGLSVRDYLYAADAADAYLLLAERMAGDPIIQGQAFNFAIGNTLTVLDVVRMVLRLMGRNDLEPVVLSAAQGETREQHLCTEKAKRLLQWTPRFDMEEGLRESIRWYGDRMAAPGRDRCCTAFV